MLSLLSSAQSLLGGGSLADLGADPTGLVLGSNLCLKGGMSTLGQAGAVILLLTDKLSDPA